MSGRLKRFANIFFSATLVVAPLGLLIWQHQNIADWLKLRSYEPSVVVSSLATQDTMTPHAKRMFYINHPQVISGVTAFRQNCSQSEQSIVLGCYHSGQNGIYLYDPNNSQLAGLEQVTAAHEVLHAIYDRLSSSDKKYVNSLVGDYYKNQLRDKRMIAQVNLYKQAEPDAILDEMHSMFGTEISKLPAALEAYYAQYFTNRQTVVAFSQKYQSKFAALQAEIKADDARLASLKSQIDSQEASLRARSSKIDADRARLDALKSSGQISQYNAGVDAFRDEVESYNYTVSLVRANIDSYNRLVKERNKIAVALASLSKSIDTRLTTQSSQ